MTGIATVANPSWDEADVSDKPSWIQSRPRLDDKTKDALNRLWKSRVRSMMAVDDLVKDVIGALQAKGKLGNTYIIFTSDNGYCLGDHRLTGKSVHYDCSSKVPLVIRGPSVPDNQTRSQIVNNLDVVATILEWSGATPGRAQEGRSLAPVIASASAPWRSALLIEMLDPQRRSDQRFKAVRTEKFKYARYDDGFEELYDLSVDPWELESKASDPAHTADLSRLRIILDKLKNCSGTGCWVE